MKLRLLLGWGVFILLGTSSYAQDSGDLLFDNSILHEIRFEFSQANYWNTLINNYENNPGPFDEKPYLMGKVIIDNVEVDSVGVRFKGFTSYPYDSDKKPIKIDFNEFVPGKRYDGLRKVNLNNATGDPGMQRDGICYDLMRSIGVKAPRTSFAKIYFNNQYWGLYQVIEQVDQEFLQNNFSNDEGNLFKNLSWSKFEWNGDSPNGYNEIFELKTNRESNDWSGFINLMDILNNTPESSFKEAIREVFNVDLFLKTLAVDVATNNWDSYLEHGRNWYIYEDTKTGIFHWIPWDYNFALSGGGLVDNEGGECELFTDFVTVGNRTPTVQFYDASFSFGQITGYLWDFGDGNTSTSEEPEHTYESAGGYQVCLTVFAGEDCEMQSCKSIFTSDNLYDCGAVTNGSFTHSVGEAFAIIVGFNPSCCDSWNEECEEFYGLISNSGDGAFDFEIDQRENEGVLIRRLLNEEEYFDRYLDYYCDLMDNHFTIEKYHSLIDHNKTLIQDAVAMDPNLFSSFERFLEDIGDEGVKKILADRIEVLSEDLVTLTDCALSPTIAFQEVVINEFVASNDLMSQIVDSAGEAEDWIELYNNSESAIDLSDAYLSDDPSNLLKWQFPSGTFIPSDGYLIVWADKDEDQAGLHSNFRLSKAGDEIYLTNADGSVIDEVEFGEQETNTSQARIPNGTGDFVNKEVTFNANNDTGNPTNTEDVLSSHAFRISPNPANDFVELTIEDDMSDVIKINIISAAGKILKSMMTDNNKTKIDLNNLSSGLYFISAQDSEGKVSVGKFIKQ
ncbi:MAG: CotH kinase family protein [Bacteroidota bacterium]